MIGGVSSLRGVSVVRRSGRIAGSSEALAWVESSLRWASERDRKKLEALLEAVAIELAYEEARARSPLSQAR
jgi:hypothetical protein